MDLVEMLFNNAMNAEGGGGGGDFVTANITFSVTGGVGLGDTFGVLPYEEMAGGECVGAFWTDDGGLGLNVDMQTVDVRYGTPKTITAYILKNHYVIVSNQIEDTEFTVTGNAETYTDTSMGDPHNAVKVYGDCAISVQGRH